VGVGRVACVLLTCDLEIRDKKKHYTVLAKRMSRESKLLVTNINIKDELKEMLALAAHSGCTYDHFRKTGTRCLDPHLLPEGVVKQMGILRKRWGLAQPDATALSTKQAEPSITFASN
jgi:hypothetical protein